MQNQEEEYTGDNLPLEIEERKDEIAEQYRVYLETRTREELIELLTINQTNCSLIESIMETDRMGSDNKTFKPI